MLILQTLAFLAAYSFLRYVLSQKKNRNICSKLNIRTLIRNDTKTNSKRHNNKKNQLR